jgi:ribosomal protein S18 acetylase RimI-like enzyme
MSRLLTRARARGWREAFGSVRDRIGSWVSSSDTLIILSRATDGLARSDIAVRPATAADAPRYARNIGTDTEASFRSRLSESTECYVVEVDGRFVHASWVAREPVWVGEIARWFRPPPAGAWVYESYTSPDHRGQGIYPSVLHALAARMRERGLEELWIGVQASNGASRRAISKGGFEERFEITYSRSLGRLTVDLARVTMPQGGDISSNPP